MRRAIRYIADYDILALRSRPSGHPAPALPRDPGAHADSQSHHLAGALRGADRHPPGVRGQARMGAGGDRVCRGARRSRRPRRAPDQGPVALRRRARQPGGFRQLRLRAGPDRLPLGPARSRQCRLDLRHGVCDLRRAAAGPLQRDDRRSEPPAVVRQFLHRRAGAGRRARGDAADLCQSARRAEVRGDDHAALYACDRIPDGVAAAGVLRQARRQARAAGNGAAGVRAGCAVHRAADRLSVVGAVDRHHLPISPACRSAGSPTRNISARTR